MLLAAGQLPVPLTRLVGRNDDLDRIMALLHRDDVRHVTLTGPPGIGKTRLGIAAARRWQDETGQRVRFVPLALVTDPDLVLPSIARAFPMPSEQGLAAERQLPAVLAQEPTLILIDNFEQLAAVAPVLTELLMRTPDLKLLVTSRAGLQTPGEHEWEVPPLALPSLVGSAKLSGLAHVPSVELLLDRAIAADRTFQLTRDNADVIAAVCVRLEGVPLAIELAAAWLKLFTPGMLLARLQQGLPVLDGDVAPGQQRTLRDAIAWSEALLDPAERSVFQQLALFSGGWRLEAAQTICRHGDPQRSTEEILRSLANKSLITRFHASGDDERYRMLAMIRAYALEQLDRSGEAEAARARHAAYFEGLVTNAAAYLTEERQVEWLDLLEREHGNLRVALRWLLDRVLRRRALALAANLENFWILHDHLFEGKRWLEEVLRMSGEDEPETEAGARGALAAILLRMGAFEQARGLVQANIDYAEASGNLGLVARSLHGLGIIDAFADEWEQSDLSFFAALAIARQIEDQPTVARVLNHLGGLSRMRGEDESALAFYTESLAIWRRIGVPERIAMVLHNMAPVLARQEHEAEAHELIGESLGISHALRNVHGVALCLMAIAGMTRRTGTQAVMAAQLLGAANALRSSIGVQWDPDDQTELARSTENVARLLDAEAFSAAVAQGRTFPLDEAVAQARQLLKAMAPIESGRAPARQPLTKREQEIAYQVSLGRTNRDIARLLSISEKTVEMHIGHSLSKLGFRSRAQLAAWIVETGGASERES